MIPALSSAIGGLHAASARIERAAGTIARGNASPEPPGKAAPPVLGGRPIDRQASDVGGADITSGLVELRLAAISYKASLATLRVADQMQDALLDVTS
jgi:hypothetical protein